MFKEGTCKEDFIYSHYAVLLFREGYGKVLKEVTGFQGDTVITNFGFNKQYWALISLVEDDNDIHKNGVMFTFYDDTDHIHNVLIQYDLLQDENCVTAYVFRTPDEQISYDWHKIYELCKIAENENKIIYRYDYYSSPQEAHFVQDVKYIKNLCFYYDLSSSSESNNVAITRKYWIGDHTYEVSVRTDDHNEYCFEITIGGNKDVSN